MMQERKRSVVRFCRTAKKAPLRGFGGRFRCARRCRPGASRWAQEPLLTVAPWGPREALSGPLQWRLSMIPSRGVRCLPWALRASAVELTPPEHRRFGGANGEGRAEAGRVCFLTVPFGLSESFRQVIRVSAHVNFRSFARFRETIVQMRV